MRMPWKKPKTTQVDLLDELATEPTFKQGSDELKSVAQAPKTTPPATSPNADTPHPPTG